MKLSSQFLFLSILYSKLIDFHDQLFSDNMTCLVFISNKNSLNCFQKKSWHSHSRSSAQGNEMTTKLMRWVSHDELQNKKQASGDCYSWQTCIVLQLCFLGGGPDFCTGMIFKAITQHLVNNSIVQHQHINMNMKSSFILLSEEAHDVLPLVNSSVVNTIQGINISDVVITLPIVVFVILIFQNVPVPDGKVMESTTCRYYLLGFAWWPHIEKVQAMKATFESTYPSLNTAATSSMCSVESELRWCQRTVIPEGFQ